jgi:hypothetical protein
MSSRLPGSYTNFRDGGLGTIAPAGDGLRLIVGPCVAGSLGLVQQFTDPQQVLDTLGGGSLADAVADQVVFGGGSVMAVRSDPDTAGSVTAVTGNPVSPAVTTSGSPTNAFEIAVRITRAGAIGTSAFQVSTDGGDRYSREIVTAATYVVPGTGITLAFAAGAYVVGNVYRFSATAPRSSVSAVQAAIRAALGSPNVYEYIQLAQSTDAAMWTALDALALEAENSFRHIWFGADVTPPPVVDSTNQATVADTWVNGRITEKASFASSRVQLFAAYAEVADSLSGELRVQSLASRILARLSKNPIHWKSAWVGHPDGALPGVNILAPFAVDASGVKRQLFNNGHALSLEQAGFTTAYTQQGRSGFYVVEDRMSAASTSDYATTPNVRVMNKARTQVRLSVLPFVQQHFSSDPQNINAVLADLVTTGTAPLRVMQSNGEITRGRMVIPPGQNFLSARRINYQIRIVPNFYARELVGDFSFENPFLTA